MATDLREIGAIDRCIRTLLNATNEANAIGAVRALFVEQLDFDALTGSIALHGDGLPPTAVRIADRDGVQVVAVRLRTTGRVLVRDIRSALKEIRGSLNGDVLLVAGDAEGGEWQLVYPGMQGGLEVLRRITLHRGQPHRTVVTQLSKVYGQAAKGDLRAALAVQEVSRPH